LWNFYTVLLQIHSGNCLQKIGILDHSLIKAIAKRTRVQFFCLTVYLEILSNSGNHVNHILKCWVRTKHIDTSSYKTEARTTSVYDGKPAARMKSEYIAKLISGSFIARKRDFITDVRTCTWYCENKMLDTSTDHITSTNTERRSISLESLVTYLDSYTHNTLSTCPHFWQLSLTVSHRISLHIRYV